MTLGKLARQFSTMKNQVASIKEALDELKVEIGHTADAESSGDDAEIVREI